MTAEEMFKEINWNKINYKDNFGYNKYITFEYKANNFSKKILFDLLTKEVIMLETENTKYKDETSVFTVSTNLLKAINKQIEELGW